MKPPSRPWGTRFLTEKRVVITPGGALSLGLLCLLDGPLLRAMLAAAFVHELGHILALKLCGARIVQLRVDLCGLCLVSTAVSSTRDEIFCALAGPAAGLLWAHTAHFWPLSAGFSLLLSTYNLLPALPLDGGRALLSLCGRRWLLRISGLLSAAALLTLALWAPFPLLIIPALWLWLEAIRA